MKIIEVTIIKYLQKQDVEDLSVGCAPIDDVDFVFYGPGAADLATFLDDYFRTLGGRDVEQYTLHFRGEERDIFLHTHA